MSDIPGNLTLVKTSIKVNTWLTSIILIINMVMFSNTITVTTVILHSVKLSLGNQLDEPWDGGHWETGSLQAVYRQ